MNGCRGILSACAIELAAGLLVAVIVIGLMLIH